ncbi:hypothetical protein BDR05DRAFT_952329 [Suillus weaverae]|nr:hypothetical protein BDR05DRAFT_952329 [Suillus weaverae]
MSTYKPPYTRATVETPSATPTHTTANVSFDIIHFIFVDLGLKTWRPVNESSYLKLSRFLFNNYQQALTIIADYTKEIEAYRAVYPDEVLDFDSWIDEELQYLITVGSEPQHDVLTVEYVDALEKLAKNAFNSSCQDQFVWYNQSSFTPNSGLSISVSQATKQGHAACRAAERQLQVRINVVEDLEIHLGVSERWTPDHEEYVKALEYSRRQHFICTVEELESLVVQCLFELLKANLASTGYKLWKQISKAIVKCSGAIRTALDKYNKLAVSQNPREVISYAVLGEFDLLKHSQHEILTKPWTNPTHREMAVKHFKVLCAREEIIRLNIEICWLQAWVDTKDTDMEQAAADLESTNSPLAAQLNMLAHCQCRINTVHRGCLMRIYCLEGYTGRTPITSSDEGNSSDVEDADVEGLDGGNGKEAACFEACIEQMSWSLKVASTFVLESDEPDGHLFRPLHRLAYLDLAFSDDNTDLAHDYLTFKFHATFDFRPGGGSHTINLRGMHQGKTGKHRGRFTAIIPPDISLKATTSHPPSLTLVNAISNITTTLLNNVLPDVHEERFKQCWEMVKLPSHLHDNDCISPLVSRTKPIGPVVTSAALTGWRPMPSTSKKYDHVSPSELVSSIKTPSSQSSADLTGPMPLGKHVTGTDHAVLSFADANIFFRAYCLPRGVLHEILSCVNEDTGFERVNWRSILIENRINETMQSSILSVMDNIHARVYVTKTS